LRRAGSGPGSSEASLPKVQIIPATTVVQPSPPDGRRAGTSSTLRRESARLPAAYEADTRAKPLDTPEGRTYVCLTAGTKLDADRLDSIERGARERHTLMDRVVIEMVVEIRRLRGIIAGYEEG
jgi:hypothetical protein